MGGMPDESLEAPAINRDLTARLVAAGEARGFVVRTEYPIRGGRVDVVWTTEIQPPVPGVDGPIPVVAFEIESSWRSRKHVKGDLLNLMDCGAPVGIIVLADGDARDESLLRFTRALIDRPGPEIQVWTRSDVVALDVASADVDSVGGGSSLKLHDDAPQLTTRTHAGKYHSLWAWLSRQAPRPVTTTFDELEEVIGGPLPPSCRKHPPHWHSYDGSAVARAIQDAGWKATAVDLAWERVTFVPAPR